MLVYSVSLEYEITKAQLLMNTKPVEAEVKTEKGGYQIKRHPIQMELDNTAFFESLNIKSAERVLKDSAEFGRKAALNATARYSKEGDEMLGPHGMTIAEIAAQRTYRTITSALDFIPKNRPETTWKDGYLDMDYIKSERNVEWKPSDIEFEYVPYKIEIHAVRNAEEFEPVNLGIEN